MHYPSQKSSPPTDWTWVFRIADRLFIDWATKKTLYPVIITLYSFLFLLSNHYSTFCVMILTTLSNSYKGIHAWLFYDRQLPNMKFSKFIHIVAHVRISLLLSWIIFHYVCYALSFHPLLIFCNPMDCSPTNLCPWISRSRMVSLPISSSRESSLTQDSTHVSCTTAEFFTAEPSGSPIVYIYIPHIFTSISVNRHLCYFNTLAIINNVATNMVVQLSL